MAEFNNEILMGLCPHAFYIMKRIGEAAGCNCKEKREINGEKPYCVATDIYALIEKNPEYSIYPELMKLCPDNPKND
jgi:hypothetical protein